MTVEHVRLLALGGTITMVDHGAGAAPDRTAQRTLREGLGPAVTLEIVDNLPSASIGFAQVIALARRILSLHDAGVRLFVLAQGTDTIEDVAFALDLMIPRSARVVVTGAMLPADHPDPDGPSNLRDSLKVARNAEYDRDGVLVCLSRRVYRARDVTKVRTSGVDAFAGVDGWIGSLRRTPDAIEMSAMQVGVPDGALPRVAIVRIRFGDDGYGLERLAWDADAIVIEALGAGHVPASIVEAVARHARRVPVVLATRIRPGRVLTDTYGYRGSERDLLGRGVLPSGALGADKAAVLLTLALAAGCTRERVATMLMTMRP